MSLLNLNFELLSMHDKNVIKYYALEYFEKLM